MVCGFEMEVRGWLADGAGRELVGARRCSGDGSGVSDLSWRTEDVRLKFANRHSICFGIKVGGGSW